MGEGLSSYLLCLQDIRLNVILTLPMKLSGFIFCSNNTDAYPTLSDETSLLVLFMLVACTAYQLITPSGIPYSLSNFSCTIVLSTLCSYLYYIMNSARSDSKTKGGTYHGQYYYTIPIINTVTDPMFNFF